MWQERFVHTSITQLLCSARVTLQSRGVLGDRRSRSWSCGRISCHGRCCVPVTCFADPGARSLTSLSPRTIPVDKWRHQNHANEQNLVLITDYQKNEAFLLMKYIRRRPICRIGCRSLWSWFDVNRSIFDENMHKKLFLFIGSYRPWLLTFIAQVIMVS